jgi:hypothetical protein
MKTLLLLAALGLASQPSYTQAQALATTPAATLASLATALAVPDKAAAILAAQAQQVAPAAPVAVAAPDTVAALHRLFAAKRKKLVPIVAGTLVADAAGIIIIGATVDGGGLIDGRVLGQAMTGILGVIAVGTEVLFYTSIYSKKKEQRAIDAFEAHQLPRHLKRQLKAKYFQELPPAAQRWPAQR